MPLAGASAHASHVREVLSRRQHLLRRCETVKEEVIRRQKGGEDYGGIQKKE